MSALRQGMPRDERARAKKDVVRAIALTADRLGNTPAICRKCYVHPAVLEAYLTGSLRPTRKGLRRRANSPTRWLSPQETALLTFLEQLPAKHTREQAPRAA